MAEAFAEYKPLFLEESLLTTALKGEWQSLVSASAIPIAAAENITSKQAFERQFGSRCIEIAQPDFAKWGSVSGAVVVATAAPHAGA